jgi:hypothetical protein
LPCSGSESWLAAPAGGENRKIVEIDRGLQVVNGFYNSMEHLLLDFWALSICAWLIYVFYITLRVQRFIVKRYEVETDLMDTIFFKENATFTRIVPSFFSSTMYTVHLLMCLWGWRIFRKQKVFRDVDNPSKVVNHFSSAELSKVKRSAVGVLIVVLHGIAYYAFKYIWPEIFG